MLGAGISKEKPYEPIGKEGKKAEATTKEEQRASAQSRRCQQVADCLKKMCSNNAPDNQTQERRNLWTKLITRNIALINENTKVPSWPNAGKVKVKPGAEKEQKQMSTNAHEDKLAFLSRPTLILTLAQKKRINANRQRAFEIARAKREAKGTIEGDAPKQVTPETERIEISLAEDLCDPIAKQWNG